MFDVAALFRELTLKFEFHLFVDIIQRLLGTAGSSIFPGNGCCGVTLADDGVMDGRQTANASSHHFSRACVNKLGSFCFFLNRNIIF